MIHVPYLRGDGDKPRGYDPHELRQEPEETKVPSPRLHDPVQTSHTQPGRHQVEQRVPGEQVVKAGFRYQLARRLSRTTEDDLVTLRRQLGGNRQGSREQAQVIGGKGGKEKLYSSVSAGV